MKERRRTKRETCDEWYARLLEYQRSLGQHGRPHAWRTWISPVIGRKRWRDVTPRDAERIRDALDAAIAARAELGPGRGRLRGRSALDVWHVLTGAARAAKRSKVRDLRALEGLPNPCADIEPPGDPRSRKPRQKPFVYPKEATQLLACRRVPRVWREVYAIAGYLYLRPGELRVLRLSDVDLQHSIVRITKAWNYTDEDEKLPKSHAGVRDVPIPSALMPLLRRLRRLAKPEDLVLPILAEGHRVTLSQRLRRHLRLAGISRASLHESTDATIQATFRSWRDSGITWLAMSGVPVASIARRAGHDDLRATMRYVKIAEDLTGKLGKPFGPLPRELTRDAPRRRSR